MNILWKYIDNRDWHAVTRFIMLLLISGILAACAGSLIWLILSFRLTLGWSSLLCMAGYPVVISWFVIFFYSCRHELHSGKPNSGICL